MIAMISFLEKGKKRIFVKPNQKGLFKLPGNSYLFTAREFVFHPAVVDNDPTLTLLDGKKYRIFHASNKNMPLVYPTIVIDDYDLKLKEKKKMVQKELDLKEKSILEKKKTLIPPFNPTASSIGYPYIADSQADAGDTDTADYDFYDDYDDGLGW